MSIKLCGIYCIENKINHKKYIGMSRDIKRRWYEHKTELNNHKHVNYYLQNAWNKYGSDNFVFKTIELCDETQLSERECYYIKLYKTLSHEDGYNLTVGGENTSIGRCVIELKNLIIYPSVTSAADNINITPITMSTWCNKRQKYMYLDEYNDLSDEQKEYCRNYDWDTINHDRLSKAHSSENLSFETKKKLSDATSGCNNPRAYKVYCPELDETFDCIKYASVKYGINNGSIGQCIKGKLKSAGCHPITGERLTWVKI